MAGNGEQTRDGRQPQDPDDAERLAEAHGKTDFAGFPEADEDAGEASSTEELARETIAPPGPVDPEREQPRTEK